MNLNNKYHTLYLWANEEGLRTILLLSPHKIVVS